MSSMYCNNNLFPDSTFSDGSEGSKKTFIILIVILAVIVIVLLISVVYFVRYVKQLKQNLTKTTDTVTMTNVSNARESSPIAKTIDDISVEDENASYTALKVNRTEEDEDHYYSGLNEAPLYVNASEFKNTT